MEELKIGGLIAAVLAPRLRDDTIDRAAMSRLIQFLLAAGISSYTLNGATGEYCLTTPEQLRHMFSAVKSAAGASAIMLCGIGAAGIAGSLELASIAEQEGASALLLPMPLLSLRSG